LFGGRKSWSKSRSKMPKNKSKGFLGDVLVKNKEENRQVLWGGNRRKGVYIPNSMRRKRKQVCNDNGRKKKGTTAFWGLTRTGERKTQEKRGRKNARWGQGRKKAAPLERR